MRKTYYFGADNGYEWRTKTMDLIATIGSAVVGYNTALSQQGL